MVATASQTRGSFEPGTLWARLNAANGRALGRGALLPIPTRSELVADGGVRFLVRILESLASKERARRRQAAGAAAQNPFLPYDEDLFVADVSPTHVALLNKFNVVDRHLLVVTRAFEDQEAPLSRADHEAMWACLAEFPSLAFYNSGETAGASQRHKHLQLVPLPLARAGPEVPIEPLLAAAGFAGRIGRAPDLPFPHALARLDPRWAESPPAAAERTLGLYRELLCAAGLSGESGSAGPYNLLITRRWMLLVPRSRECFEGISLNALGFAGALLVRDEEQLALVKERGPMTALKSVAAVS